MNEWKNRLYFGDNLKILRDPKRFPDEFVDLVYLDPPFNSSATYNVLFAEKSGKKSAAQIKAFEDTWEWGLEAEQAFEDILQTAPARLAEMIRSFRQFLGSNNMMAYLVMMAPRLVELHRVLKPTGSLYLHCDPTASHYLKILMDTIFDIRNFRSEIVWKRSSAHSDTKQGRKQHGRIHDVLLFYTKGDEWLWNPIHTAYDEEYVERFYRHVEPETGRRYRLGDLTGPGGAAKGNPEYEVMGVTRFWRYSREKMDALIEAGRVVQTKPGAVPQYKRYLDEMKGVTLQDVWNDINPIGPQAQERLGYPTQKPEALMERIIKASSNAGDIVLDPFAGCGTTINVAEKLHRKWVGIDVTPLAVNLIRFRLQTSFADQAAPYVIDGVPEDVSGAKALAEKDRYQFQLWALGLIGARPSQEKKGADRGLDGVAYFRDDESGKDKKLVAQVKSGEQISSRDIRDLVGTLKRENAEIGVFITLEPPTGPMVKEAATAGFYDPHGLPSSRVPKLQILSIEELLAGKGVHYPNRLAVASTFKASQRQTKAKGPEQQSLY